MEDEEIANPSDPLHGTEQVGSVWESLHSCINGLCQETDLTEKLLCKFQKCKKNPKNCCCIFRFSRVMNKSQREGSRVRKDAYANTIINRFAQLSRWLCCVFVCLHTGGKKKLSISAQLCWYCFSKASEDDGVNETGNTAKPQESSAETPVRVARLHTHSCSSMLSGAEKTHSTMNVCVCSQRARGPITSPRRHGQRLKEKTRRTRWVCPLLTAAADRFLTCSGTKKKVWLCVCVFFFFNYL